MIASSQPFQLEILQGISLPETAFFYSNGLAMWPGYPDITHVNVNNGCKSAILNLIKLNIFRAYPSLKPHILFYSNDLAIWHGFP